MNLISMMRHYSIRTRMVGAICLVVALLLGVGGVGLGGMWYIEKITSSFIDGASAKQAVLAQLQESITRVRIAERDMIISYERVDALQKQEKVWRQGLVDSKKAAAKLIELSDETTKPQLQAAVVSLDEYAGKFEPVLKQLLASAYDSASTIDRLLGNAKAAVHAAETKVAEVHAVIETQAQQTRQEASQVFSVAAMTFVAVVVLAVAVVTLLTLLNMLSINRPLTAARKAARAIADGDLTGAIEVSGRDEIAGFQSELQQMQQSLRRMVEQVRESTQNITVASTEVASGNQDLSQRTEQTASNLQQTASSMEQLTSTVKNSADSAAQANQLASSAAVVAHRGGDVVSKVVATMGEINTSSKKIAEIISVIDGIAFQTNILALNAAVEAARAGEQGRGFAVVASEVRSLAQRSAAAAKEIKGLIDTSVDKVETGSRLVSDAGSTMDEIVASVQRVTDIIGEISAAAGEQSSGIGQVNSAVTQLDQMTQQNAALVEESAAAAESLKEQARRLSDVVGQFRLVAA